MEKGVKSEIEARKLQTSELEKQAAEEALKTANAIGQQDNTPRLESTLFLLQRKMVFTV